MELVFLDEADLFLDASGVLIPNCVLLRMIPKGVLNLRKRMTRYQMDRSANDDNQSDELLLVL